MKKLLALLLALIMCLGLLVSCDNEESSSESLDLEVKETKDSWVEYYYIETYSEEKEDAFQVGRKIELVKSASEFLDFVSPLCEHPETLSISSLLDDEELYETHYVLKVTLYAGTRGSIIGYRNLSISEDGKCSLILDNIHKYDTQGYYDGKPSYSANIIPYENNISEEEINHTVYYDFILIPKDKVNIELTEQTKIDLYKLTYPIQRKLA